MNLLHLQSRTKSLIYGLNRETEVYDMIYKIFTGDIKRANYKFSFFDFFSQSKKILFELKCLTYSINTYKTAVMNTSKLEYNHIIFIFEYTNNDKTKTLYYHIYDESRAYNKRYITPFNRLNSCEVIDIPICELVEIEPNTIYDFDFTEYITDTDTNNFNDIMKKDLKI